MIWELDNHCHWYKQLGEGGGRWKSEQDIYKGNYTAYCEAFVLASWDTPSIPSLYTDDSLRAVLWRALVHDSPPFLALLEGFCSPHLADGVGWCSLEPASIMCWLAQNAWFRDWLIRWQSIVLHDYLQTVNLLNKTISYKINFKSNNPKFWQSHFLSIGHSGHNATVHSQFGCCVW